MPPGLSFGWVPPQLRTREMHEACDQAVRSMPKFSVSGKIKYGKRAGFANWSKVANGGKHLDPFFQEKGSCVGNGYGKMLWRLSAIQKVKLGEMISMVMPFWLLTYGRGRELSGMRGKGDGSTGAGMAKAAENFGTGPIDKAGVPQPSIVNGGLCFGAKNEILYSTTQGIAQAQLDAAKPYLVRTVAPVRSADDVRDSLCGGHGVTIASNWGGLMKCEVKEGVLMSRRVTTWNHQMEVCDWAEHDKLGEIFNIGNSWGNPHGIDPFGGPPGSFWVHKAEMEYIVRQNDSFAFSSFVGFPAQDMEIDFYV